MVLAQTGLRPGSEQAEELLLGGDLCLLLLMKMARRLMVRMRRMTSSSALETPCTVTVPTTEQPMFVTL